MSTTTSGVRMIDMPDLGAVSDSSSVIGERAGSGRFSAPALKAYATAGFVPEAPSGTAYGRWDGVWQPVLPLVGGTLSGALVANGDIESHGLMFAEQIKFNQAQGYEWRFYVDGNGNHVQEHTSGWTDFWESSGGSRGWAAPTGTLMALDSAGNLSANGRLNAVAYWSSQGANPGDFGFGVGGSGRIFSFMPSFYLDLAMAGPTAGTLQYVVSNGPLWVMRASDDFCFNPQSAVGGNGAYINSSDRRMKEAIAPTTKGLAEVLQLEPVEFTRADPTNGAHREIGFVAQDVQPIVPEAVWSVGIPLRDGSGGLDSEEPTLGLSEATITALLVNAIKELHAANAALTARITTLEGASA